MMQTFARLFLSNWFNIYAAETIFFSILQAISAWNNNVSEPDRSSMKGFRELNQQLMF